MQCFLPDITIGAKNNDDYASLYNVTVHEMAHASHYAQVGKDYWTPYIMYVIQSFVTEGRSAYGSGGGDGAGYCELGEMWGYFMQASLFKDRYGGVMRNFGGGFWFKPYILSYLYERGMSRGEIYRALNKNITGIDDFKEELVSLYPDREEIILETFRKNGK